MLLNKFCFFLILILSTLNCWSQNALKFSGEWNGKLKDASGEFEYKLKLEHYGMGAYRGVSTSKSSDFYCESRVTAFSRNGQLIVNEVEVLKTDYPNKLELCLLKLSLKVSASTLSGEFQPISNTSDCLSGTLHLVKTSPVPTKPLATSFQSAKAKKDISQPALRSNKPNDKGRELQIVRATEDIEKPKEPKRRVENKIKVLDIDDTEVELTIVDNMEVDGDIITLIHNDNIIFRKAVLTKIPLTYKINNARTSTHLIKFHAENLGRTPPNTGVLIVKSRETTTRTDFVSDFNQTSTVQINLRKPSYNSKSAN